MDFSTRPAYVSEMGDTAELTYELLKKVHAEFGDFRRDMASVKARLSSVEQHQSNMASDLASVHGDLARIHLELDAIRDDVSRIKRRLDLVDV